MLYGQTLSNDETTVSVNGCPTRQDAVELSVGIAFRSGMRPPQWWQFWEKRWPLDCVDEFTRVSTEA